MSRYLYFDLEAVVAQAQHAVLADRNLSTPSGVGSARAAKPALWFYRHLGQPRLASNGRRAVVDMLLLPPSVAADNCLTTPAAQPPHVNDPQCLPLLDSTGPSLIDVLTEALAEGAQWAMLDPHSLTVGAGRRRRRGRSSR